MSQRDDLRALSDAARLAEHLREAIVTARAQGRESVFLRPGDASRIVDLLAASPSPATDAGLDVVRIATVRRDMIDGIGVELSREFEQANPFEPFDRVYVAKTITRILDEARARTRVAAGSDR